jgi:alkylation response protein AidB-like acyl-CoA dehydrogenase
LIDAARSVAPLARERAEAGETARELAPDLVTALAVAGLFRMFVPTSYGGPEADPVTALGAIEIVATADGAAGWCVNIAATTSSMSWYLAPDWATEIYGNPLAVTGGTFAPNGRARRAEGGYVIDSGRWAWGSGTQHCQWINCGVRADDGTFHLMYVPAAEVTFLDTWHASGLRGTGSTDFEVHGAFVPDGRSLQPTVTKSQVERPLCHFPNFSLLAAGLACVALGIGRRAVDELVELAAGEGAGRSRTKLGALATVQVDLARAEAALGGARIGTAQRARLRLAAANAAAEAARATDLAYTAAGGAAVYASHPLQRCLRDVHVATQHAMLSPRNLETFARLRLGLDADTGLL